jgi:hypothetical protein
MLLPKVEKVSHNGAHFVSILQLGSEEVLILGGGLQCSQLFLVMGKSIWPIQKKKEKRKREM